MSDIKFYSNLSSYTYETDVLKGKKYYVNEKVKVAGKKYIVLDISRDGTYGKKHAYGSVNSPR